MVYLVRHAHAGSKKNWQGPDQARPLSAQGRKEALGLTEQLGDRPLGRLLSSPAERCLQTVEPLADRLGHPVETSEALGVDGTGPGVLELLTSPALADAVLCTHGELIGELFRRLRQQGAPIHPRAGWPKGSTWRLDIAAGAVTGATYLPPLATSDPADRLPTPTG